MNTKNKLILSQSLFTLILIVIFGLIIVNEKGDTLFSKKVKQKINNYIDENYSSIKDSIKQDQVDYKDTVFKMKIISKENPNRYFYIIYKHGNITDTYKKDYQEANTLLNNTKNNMEKEIYNKTKTKYNVHFLNKYNNYNTQVKKELLKNNTPLNLKIYYLSKELTMKDINETTLTNIISNKINTTESNNITPKYYEFTIINKNDISKTLTISNINKDFIKTPYNSQIIKNILMKQPLQNTNITYKYN